MISSETHRFVTKLKELNMIKDGMIQVGMKQV